VGLVSEEPACSVVIPVLDDAARLAACLDALGDQDADFGFEVIVVDNGSSDDVAGVVHGRPAVRLLEEHRRSSYAARNRGVEVARAPVLAFTDADCLPATDWVRRGVAAVAGPEVGWVAGRIDVFPARAGRLSPAEAYDVVAGFPQADFVRRLHFGATANLFTRRDVIDRVGPFDPELQSGGDREWGRRVVDAGFDGRHAHDVVIAHPARPDLRALRSKLQRVLGGEQDLRARGVITASYTVPDLVRGLFPPVNAIRRAAAAPALTTARDRAAYVAAEVFMRYAGTFERARLVREERRRRR
jgi:glycosyltransferase involved in cell wall biosynthesis